MTPAEALDELRQIAAFSDLGLAERLHAIIDALDRPAAVPSSHPVDLDPLDSLPVTLPEWPETEVMDMRQTMQLLGYTSRQSIYDAIKRGLPVVEGHNGKAGRGNKRTFRRSEVLAWMNAEIPV